MNFTYRSPRFISQLAALAFLGLTATYGAPPAGGAAPTETALSSEGGGGSDEIVRLSEVEVTTTPASALTEAVTESKTSVMQPQSFISVQTINNTMAPTDDYASIANIAPSTAAIETGGPGLSEGKLIMRGFQDGQYNVTYDGIPFGDINGATHHTTSYFPAKVLGGLVVDRGPGTATDIGENTLGGTIGLLSKDPRPDQAVVLTVSDGSWNTFLGNVEVNTGDMPKLNNASMIMTYQYMSSDTYRTYSYLQRNTYYLKFVQPISRNTTLTVVGNYNNIKFNNPAAVTQAEINQYGRNIGLVANPFDPNALYYPYNWQQKQADFEYIGLTSKFGAGFGLENKLYTYYYNNDSHESPTDPVVGGTTKYPGTASAYTGPAYTNNSPNTLPGTTSASNDDPGGRIKVNAYRATGDYFVLTHGADTPFAEKIGAWGEYVRSNRYAYDLDYSPNYLAANPQDATYFGAFDPSSGVKNNIYKPGYQWFMHDDNKTFVPFVDFIWKPVPALTLEAGVKYQSYTIDLEAPVNQGTEQPDFSNETYTSAEPHFSANYLLTPNWSVYFQWAEGQMYPIVTEEENVPSDPKDANGVQFNAGNLKTESSINYQVGTVFKTDRFNADADVYLINISNLISSVTDPNDSTNQLVFQSKGAWVSGFEVEGTYYLGEGLSAYANGSLNRATYKTDPGVPSFAVASLGTGGAGGNSYGVPSSTGAIGLIYHRSGWFASLEDKYIGSYVIYSSALTDPDLGLYGQTSTGLPGQGTNVPVPLAYQGGWAFVDLAGGYGFTLPKGDFFHSFKIKLQVDNITARKVQVLSAVGATPAANTYSVLPTASWFLTFSMEF